ncbi:MAG: pirin family protein [Sphingobacteriales bacterium]|nr:pirin family protein [Sphingobacteriales bacterium]
MKTVFYPAQERGFNNLGWLKSYHSFNFGRFYDPHKMNFGLLRVLNDDHVEAGMGFGTHSHDNMEIVSIPLSGALKHNDSTGREAIIKSGDVQIMSAGTGIQHSEYNASKTEAVKFLQIWIFPKEENITPRYEQKAFSEEAKQNKFLTAVSPEKDAESIWINQDAWFNLSNLDEGKKLNYTLNDDKNGIYVFLLEGSLNIAGKTLKERDAIGVYDIKDIDVEALTAAKLLLIEVPMQ